MQNKRCSTIKVPTLRRHKRSARGYARFDGQEVWFGPWTDARKPEAETRAAFDSYLARWLANDRRPLDELGVDNLTIDELADRWLAHLRQRGASEGVLDAARLALEPLRQLFGPEPAAEFTPRNLKAVRQALLRGKVCRQTVNQRTQTVRRCFRWGVADGYLPASVLEGLRAVDHLVRGEHGVREGIGTRQPVDETVVRAALEELHPVVGAIIEVLWLTGARVGEVLGLTPAMLDRTGPVWVAKLEHHKTAGKGKSRELAFGPQAQAVLRRFLDRVPAPPQDKPLFSPRLAVAHVLHERRAGRQTPLWPGHVARYEREKAERDRQQLGDQYDASALRHAVDRAMDRVNRRRAAAKQEPLPYWTPYQIRHSALSRIRLQLGAEAAQAVGGHAAQAMSAHYTVSAEAALQRNAMAKLG